MEDTSCNQKLSAIQEAYIPLLGKYLDEVQNETPTHKNLKTLYNLLTSGNEKLVLNLPNLKLFYLHFFFNF